MISTNLVSRKSSGTNMFQDLNRIVVSPSSPMPRLHVTRYTLIWPPGVVQLLVGPFGLEIRPSATPRQKQKWYRSAVASCIRIGIFVNLL